MKTPKNNLGRVKKIVLLGAVGLLALTTTVFGYQYLGDANANSSVSIQNNQAIPARIQIPSVNVDLAIEASGYDTNTKEWYIGTTNAHWANSTQKLDAKTGLTLIYAHNQTGLFKPTYDMQPGAEITITDTAGTKRVYKYVESSLALPSDTRVLQYSGSHQVVLLCCYGSNNELRKLMNLEYVRTLSNQ